MADEGFGPFSFGVRVCHVSRARVIASSMLSIGNFMASALSLVRLRLRVSLTHSWVSMCPRMSIACQSSHNSKHGLETTASTSVLDLHSRNVSSSLSCWSTSMIRIAQSKSSRCRAFRYSFNTFDGSPPMARMLKVAYLGRRYWRSSSRYSGSVTCPSVKTT